MKTQEAAFGDDALDAAWRIEEVLDRAHEIHRARGGVFGYDLEDWLEAERELAERNRPARYPAENAARVEPLSFNRERNGRQNPDPPVVGGSATRKGKASENAKASTS